MANAERVKQIFAETEAVITGSHIIYASKLHGTDYVNKDAVMPRTLRAFELCRMIAEMHKDKGIDVVVGPATGGISLAWGTALALSQITERETLSVYAEKKPDDSFFFSRGHDKLIPGKRLLVVEDVLTTGGSVKRVLEALQPLGGQVISLGALCNRGGVKPTDIGVPEINALLEVSMKSWKPEECPMCEAGIPINRNVGHGKNLPPSRP